MISNITIKDVSSYDSVGVQIDNLKRLNFFFGFNGTGKSTIAKYLYHLHKGDVSSSKYANCSQVGFSPVDTEILVFNNEFTERNFNCNHDLPGIFSLDEINKEIEEQINQIKNSIDKNNNYISARNEIKTKVKQKSDTIFESLKNDCFQKRDTFKSFSKIRLDHSGSKQKHLQYIETKIGLINTYSETIESLSSRYKKLYESNLNKIEKRVDILLFEKVQEIEANSKQILNEVIVGNSDVDISSLISSLNIGNWVEQGINFAKSSNGKCPFCQQNTIDQQLMDKFTRYFDKTFTQKVDQIKKIKENYHRISVQIKANLDEVQHQYNTGNETYQLIQDLQAIFSKNEGILNEKISNPNERKTLDSIKLIVDKAKSINQKIDENNSTFAQLDIMKTSLIEDIWIYMAKECQSAIKIYNNKKKQCDRIAAIIDQLSQNSLQKNQLLQSSLHNLQAKTKNTGQAVTNIKTILNNAGFSGFSIEENKMTNNIPTYSLIRESVNSSENVFETLSEGEKSFISFLYFFQLCIGSGKQMDNTVQKKKIIVIDDPITSMDSQILYIVSSLIQNLAMHKEGSAVSERQSFKRTFIEQIFILTHNSYFYNEVSFDKRPICTAFCHFFVVKNNGKSNVINKGHNKPISDDYELMWQSLREIKRENNIPQSYNVTIANTMRRIIESYVKFVGIGKDCWASIEHENQDDSRYFIKCAFLSDINKESHATGILDDMYFSRITNISPELLFDTFKEIFQTIGNEHYSYMMKES